MHETDLKPKPPVSPIRTKEETANLFKAEMPSIPGVNEAKPVHVTGPTFWRLHHWAGLAGGVIVLLITGAAGWRFAHEVHSKTPSAIAVAVGLAAAPPVAPPPVVADFHPIAGAVTAGTLKELAQPWSAKQFTYIKSDTNASVPAMVIRLPGTSGDRAGAYWAFALAAPYSTCNLDYVTDLKALAARYGYRAHHPMLVAACDGTVFDPLRTSVIPTGAYARGEIVQGPGIRPPIAIRIQVHGQSLIADRIEDSPGH